MGRHDWRRYGTGAVRRGAGVLQVASLGQGQQALVGWVAEGRCLRGPGAVRRFAGVLPGGASRVRAKDSDRLIRRGWCLRSSGIVREVLGVGPGDISKARPRTPKRSAYIRRSCVDMVIMLEAQALTR